MNYKNIEFHNVGELLEIEGGGVKLHRFPESVIKYLGSETNKRGRQVAKSSAGCEIRLVTKSSGIEIILEALNFRGRVVIYVGDFYHSCHNLEKNRKVHLTLEKHERFQSANSEMLKGSYSPDLWRIQFDRANNFTGVLHHISCKDFDFRAPNSEEKPSQKALFYGSSITNGAGATLYNNCFVEKTAKRLHIGALNKGMSGTCFIEKEMADYIVDELEWDFIVLELGINMRLTFSTEEFQKRAEYLLSRLIEKYPNKKIFLIDIFPNYATNPNNEFRDRGIAEKSFKEVIETLVKEFNHNNLHHFKGSDFLDSYTLLTEDVLHPSDDGHSSIAEVLSNRIKDIIL